jgi:hypothetical protein
MVVAPQFTLDPKFINTYYPPNGHQDEGRILPHIVFNDPHVPWFREAGTADWMSEPIDKDPPDSTDQNAGRNFVPWLAVLVFLPDELRVDADAAKSLKLSGMKSYDASKLPADGSFKMTVADYLGTISSRVHYEAGFSNQADFLELRKSAEVMSAIFPTIGQVKAIFGSQSDRTTFEAHKLLAHVRHVNTIGFPDSGVEEEGFYSVVVSSMTGNQRELTPTTHVVHLVSIEHVVRILMKSHRLIPQCELS